MLEAFWSLPKVNGLPPNGRGSHSCVKLNDKNHYVFYGGADRIPNIFDDVWLLEADFSTVKNPFEIKSSKDCDLPEFSWTRICPNSKGVHPPKLSGTTFTAFGPRYLALFGGTNPISGSCSNDIFLLDTETWRWIEPKIATELKPPPRHSHVAVVSSNGRLVIYGGAGESGKPLDDLWILEQQANLLLSASVSSKSEVSSAVDSPLSMSYSAETVLVWRKVKQVAGSPNILLSALETTANKGSHDAISSREAKIPEPREMHAACLTSVQILPNSASKGKERKLAEVMVVMGGRNANGSVLSDIHIMDLDTMTWIYSENYSTAYARCAHALVSCSISGACLNEIHLISYGGFTGTSVSGDTIRFPKIFQLLFPPSPATSKAPAPIPVLLCKDVPATSILGQSGLRFAHSMVTLTDPEKNTDIGVILFGGVNPAKDLSDIAILLFKNS